jgi:hypothetical protein
MKRSVLDIDYDSPYRKRINLGNLIRAVMILFFFTAGVITLTYAFYARQSPGLQDNNQSVKKLEKRLDNLEEQIRVLELRVSEAEKRLEPEWVTDGAPIRKLSNQVIVSVELIRSEHQDIKFTLHVGQEKPMHFSFREADIPARQLFVWNQQTYFFDILEVDKAGKRVKIGIVPKLDEL